jgi:hypothetical protein
MASISTSLCTEVSLSMDKVGRKLTRRYASDLTPDQKDALLDVIRARPHPTISAEIRREIVTSVERGAPRPGESDDVVMR